MMFVLCKLRVVNSVSWHIESSVIDFIWPDNFMFELRSRNVRAVNLPIVSGIVPSMLVPYMFNECKVVKFPSDEGMEPLMSVLLRSMFVTLHSSESHEQLMAMKCILAPRSTPLSHGSTVYALLPSLSCVCVKSQTVPSKVPLFTIVTFQFVPLKAS